MAEDIRSPDSVSSDLRSEIIKEALRQSESCLYTSTSLFEWLRWVRIYNIFFIAAPIVLGGIASLSILKKYEYDVAIALCALGASLFPALAEALKIKPSIDEITRLSAEFKALQDRFRALARIAAPFENVQDASRILKELMDRLEVARSASITAPRWAFERARQKIAKGDYSFEVDKGSAPRN